MSLPTDQPIHVVDDDEAIRRSLSFMLKTSGFSVRLFSGGTEFLKEVGTLEGAYEKLRSEAAATLDAEVVAISARAEELRAAAGALRDEAEGAQSARDAYLEGEREFREAAALAELVAPVRGSDAADGHAVGVGQQQVAAGDSNGGGVLLEVTFGRGDGTIKI